MNFFFKNTQKKIILSEKHEHHTTNKHCRFWEQEIISNKVRDHCHLTGKSRGPAHNKFIINVTQKQSDFYSICLS